MQYKSKETGPMTNFIAEVHALSHEGRGIASLSGKTIFLDGALPGETVRFEIFKKHRRFDEGRVVEVLKASRDRVLPPCPHFFECGGCSLQHMDPNAQLLFKEKTVLEQLRHFGGISLEPKNILPPVIGPTLGYRRKARLGVKFVAKKGKVLVGFREKRHHLLADLEICKVLEPSVGNLLETLKKRIAGLQGYAVIPQIEVAIGDTRVALVFRHLEPLCVADQDNLIAFGKEHHIAIYLQPEGTDSVYLLTAEAVKNQGLQNSVFLNYSIPEFSVDFEFKPTDFTQVNAFINQKMISRVIEVLELKSTDRVLDLFCGLGNFTLPLARKGAHVVGVEGSEEAVSRAIHNAKHNQIENVSFYVENLQKNHFENAWAHMQYDKVLLDPPRTGAWELIPLLSTLPITRLVYVSCNPATLARDIGALVNQHHFQLESLGILDMFPHTTHIESMAVLTKHG